ncbi:GSCOCG00013130001-RA-CDS, partial [Cotesia congregata]
VVHFSHFYNQLFSSKYDLQLINGFRDSLLIIKHLSLSLSFRTQDIVMQRISPITKTIITTEKVPRVIGEVHS